MRIHFFFLGTDYTDCTDNLYKHTLKTVLIRVIRA